MNKIIAFVIIIPFIFIILFNAIMFFDYSYRQMTLKNKVDAFVYEVKLTGKVTANDYIRFKNSISKLANFDDSSIKFYKGKYDNGTVTINPLQASCIYNIGEKLYKDNKDAFAVQVTSINESLYSKAIRLFSGGLLSNEKLHYKSIALCRIEAQ